MLSSRKDRERPNNHNGHGVQEMRAQIITTKKDGRVSALLGIIVPSMAKIIRNVACRTSSEYIHAPMTSVHKFCHDVGKNNVKVMMSLPHDGSPLTLYSAKFIFYAHYIMDVARCSEIL